MTDKQNYFTYTDNTTDDNDKTMENLHKQIIIDGVDVSGCPYYIDSEGGCSSHDCECIKCVHNVCFYKDYKAKEQEYEELRQYHNKCCEENAKKEAEWLEKFNQVSIGFYNGDYCNTEHCSLLKSKEQECEELKGIRDRNFLSALEEQKRADKLSKTLTEIKEIAERDKKFCIECNGDKEIDCIDCIEGGRALLAKDILQKISEVEDVGN